MKSMTMLAAGLLAAAILTGAAEPARADSAEAASASAAGSFSENTGGLFAGIGAAIKEWWKNEQQRAVDEGIDWSNHPCKPDEERVDGGDSGVICRSKERFTVSCDVTEWDTYQDEGGLHRVPRTIGDCTCNGKPCNGFAGDGSGAGTEPQAP